MDLVSVAKLPFSTERGWPELVRLRPGLLRLFVFLVLPLSLVPPVMLQLAGAHHPGMLADEISRKPWGQVAAVFFMAEIATFLAMGWFIKQVAATHKLVIDYHDAYLIAGIAPAPMWLSALGLLIPGLLASAVIAVIGLVLSCGIVYHGVLALCRTREDVVAEGIVQTVISAGIIAWAALLLVILV